VSLAPRQAPVRAGLITGPRHPTRRITITQDKHVDERRPVRRRQAHMASTYVTDGARRRFHASLRTAASGRARYVPDRAANQGEQRSLPDKLIRPPTCARQRAKATETAS